jgi:hypothetical protein
MYGIALHALVITVIGKSVSTVSHAPAEQSTGPGGDHRKEVA